MSTINTKKVVPSKPAITALVQTGSGQAVNAEGTTKSDGTPLNTGDLDPILVHDSNPAIAGWGQGKILANQAQGVFVNAH